MNTKGNTHVRRAVIATVLSVLSVAMVVSLAACGSSAARDMYPCSSEMVFRSSKPMGMGEFADATNPVDINSLDWLQLLNERNQLFTDRIKPGTVMVVPRTCGKGEQPGAVTKLKKS